jgi:hypothetical protein
MRAKISVREEDRTLQLLAAALTNREIGRRLGLSAGELSLLFRLLARVTKSDFSY